MMKLSETTIETLKNFATINPFMVFKSGRVQKTLSPEKIILAEATLSEEFPTDFAIYDLSQFLGAFLSLDDPSVSFSKESLELVDNNFSILYHACSPDVGISPPDSDLTYDNPITEFTLKKEDLKKLLTVGGILDTANLIVKGISDSDKSGLYVEVGDQTNATSNYGLIRISDYDGKAFEEIFDIEHLKLVLDTYKVSIVPNQLGIFENSNTGRKYYISTKVKE